MYRNLLQSLNSQKLERSQTVFLGRTYQISKETNLGYGTNINNNFAVLKELQNRDKLEVAI